MNHTTIMLQCPLAVHFVPSCYPVPAVLGNLILTLPERFEPFVQQQIKLGT